MSRKTAQNRLERVSARSVDPFETNSLDDQLLDPETLEEPELLEFAYLSGPKRLGNTEFEWDDLPNWEPLLNGREPNWK
jgi:hypothetical protein